MENCAFEIRAFEICGIGEHFVWRSLPRRILHLEGFALEIFIEDALCRRKEIGDNNRSPAVALYGFSGGT